MNSLWPSRVQSEANAPPSKPDQEIAEETAAIADIGPETSEQPNPPPQQPQPQVQQSSIRPLLMRNSSAPPLPPAVPPPPNQPPPPPIGNAPPPPPDSSLSLAQLRRIVAEFPKAESVAYDFTYEDMGPIDEEIDEWFVYQFWQWVRLNASQRAFEAQWEEEHGADTSWDDVDEEKRSQFVSQALTGLASSDIKERLSCLGRLVYIALGRWTQTAKRSGAAAGNDSKARSASTPRQLEAMKAGAKLIGDAGGAVIIWDALRKAFDPFWYVEWSILQVRY